MQAKPTPTLIRQTAPGRNFCSLLAYYVIEVVRRRTGADINWHDRASAMRALPPEAQLPDAPFARLVALCPDQGAAFMPLGWVEAQLLGEGAPTTARDCIGSLIQQIKQDGPAVWWTGMNAVGRIASWQMMMAADGGAVLPTRLSSKAPNSWVVLMSGVSGEDVNEALKRGARSLEENPEGAIWQVLAYDGITDLSEQGIDAVMVILHTYGPSPLKLKLAFPYRRAKVFRGFQILSPQLRQANVEYEKIAMLNGAMERGIQSIKWAFGKTWNQLRKG